MNRIDFIKKLGLASLAGVLFPKIMVSENEPVKNEITIHKKYFNSVFEIKSYEDACASKGEKPVHVYHDKMTRKEIINCAHNRLMDTIEVLNEGYKFKMDKIERRYYIWWELDHSSPSGLRFLLSHYNFDHVFASSAAHLSFRTYELAKHTHDSPEILKDWSKFVFGK